MNNRQYAIAQRVAEATRRDEYNALRKLRADTLEAHTDSWAAYNGVMQIAEEAAKKDVL